MNSTQKRRALVTGATGYIGSHLTRRLVRDGWETHVVLRPASSRALIADLEGRIAVHVHDGSTSSMLDLVGAARPDVVFHLSSLFLAQHRPDDIEQLIESNIRFAAQIAEAMTAQNVRNLVNTGTVWQHYDNRDYCPVNLYAATKQACESLLTFYIEARSLQVITLTLFDTYGPCDPRPKLFKLLRSAAAEGKPLLMSPGEQLLDLVYIDDVIEAYCLAADRLTAGTGSGHEHYAVCTGRPLRLRDVVAAYESATGKRVPIAWGGRPYRDREMMVPWTKGVPVPGWTPRVPLEAGIRRMEGAPS